MTDPGDGRHYPSTPLLGVSTAVWRAENLLIIQRGKQPMQGVWSLPGGLVEVGEELVDAAARELAEETGVTGRDYQFIEFIEIIRRDEADRIAGHFVLAFFTALWAKGEPVAGDDAMAARWAKVEEAEALDFTPGTLERAARNRPA